MLTNKRVNLKPWEYPEVLGFKSAIQNAYWLHTKWSFTSDTHQYRLMDTRHQEAARRSMLVIAQTEVAVKDFWGHIGDHFPLPEIKQVGYVFAESEVRHADAYQNLIEVLGLSSDFAELVSTPVMKKRLEFMDKYLKRPAKEALVYFTLFMENTSLFSQFLTLRSYYYHTHQLKDIDDVIKATQKEELVHAMFGAWLINQMKKEGHSFDVDAIYVAALHAEEMEREINDWIFEHGALDFISKHEVQAFTRQRIDAGLKMIELPPIWGLSPSQLWFDLELKIPIHNDAFHKASTDYDKWSSPVSIEELFDVE